MKEDSENKRIISDISSLSDQTISLAASIGLGALLVAPAFMAILASFKRSIDYTMMIYLSMIKNLVFPFACSITFLIYIVLIVRLYKQGVKLQDILKKNPLFILFAICVIWMLGSQFYNGADYAFSSFAVDSLGETFGMELSYFVFILFGATQVKIEKHKRCLLRIEVIASMILVVAAFILWHTQTDSQLFSDWEGRETRFYFVSIFSNINYYGYYLSVAVPIAGAAFVYEKGFDSKGIKWKVISGISFMANVVALSLADSLGAWIGAGIGIIFIFISHLIIEKKFNLQAFVLIPTFGICLFVPGHIAGTFENSFFSFTGDVSNIVTGNDAAQQAGSGRIAIWKDSLDVINDNKVYGVGFEGIMFFENNKGPSNARPHNEFIQYAMFHGIPTGVLYFIGCFGIFIRALKKRRNMNGATLVSLAGALGYLVSSFFGLTVFSTAYFLFIFLGMGYVNDSNVADLGVILDRDELKEIKD